MIEWQYVVCINTYIQKVVSHSHKEEWNPVIYGNKMKMGNTFMLGEMNHIKNDKYQSLLKHWIVIIRGKEVGGRLSKGRLVWSMHTVCMCIKTTLSLIHLYD
jgi:hypothetical protein